MDFMEMIWLTQTHTSNTELKSTADDIRREIELNDYATRKELRELRMTTLKLTTICEVVCDLLIQKLGVDKAELQRRVEEGLRVYRMDSASHCQACGHLMPPTKEKCIYCGKPREKSESVKP